MNVFNSGKEKMLRCSDFDLNSVQLYSGSLKEGVKQTMLKQEVIFRKQVQELHRIYGVQKSLMMDLGYKESNRYNSWQEKAESFPLPVKTRTRNEPLVEETKFSSISKVHSTPVVRQELLEGRNDAFCRLQQRRLDLQLSADEFIIHDEEDIPMKENVWISLKEPVDVRHNTLCGSNSLGPEELKLSLSTGQDNCRKESKKGSFDGNTQSCISVIDLEESVESSDGYAKCMPSFGCAALKFCYKVKFKSKDSMLSDPIISNYIKKDPSQEIPEGISFQEYSEYCKEQASSDEGLIEGRDDIPCNDISCKMKRFTLCEGGHLDLNKAQFDDSARYSNDHILANPSSTSSVGGFGAVIDGTQEETYPTTFWKKEVKNRPNEISDLLSQDNVVDPGHVDFNSKNNSIDIYGRNPMYHRVPGIEVNLIGPGSISRPPVGLSNDLGCCSADHTNDNVELNSKLQNSGLHDLNHTSIATREVSTEASEVEDAVFSCTDQTQNTSRDGNKSPTSCKSCVFYNDSSNAKTMHLGVTSGVLSQEPKTHLRSQGVKVLSGEPDIITSDSGDLSYECYKKKEESAEVDVSIQRAAELLINISLGNSTCYQDSYAKARPKEMENNKLAQPQYSSDSYELIVMNLSESNEDDGSISSKSYEIDDIVVDGGKDFGFKLRRGRRLKDFQKEILPGIASLSRQEISEDINIMVGVLRSREYRRMRAKMATHGEKESPPKRSRRLGHNHVGRKNISWKLR